MKVFLCFISETSFYPAHLSFSITVKTTKLVLLRFHVLYLSTAALLMFTERLQFWDTPGLESVYEICNITIFFITTKKITKWKGIFHISTENCQKFLICAGFITFIFGKNFCFDQRGGKIISLNQKSDQSRRTCQLFNQLLSMLMLSHFPKISTGLDFIIKTSYQLFARIEKRGFFSRKPRKQESRWSICIWKDSFY